jgi:hypothetical protein
MRLAFRSVRARRDECPHLQNNCFTRNDANDCTRAINAAFIARAASQSGGPHKKNSPVAEATGLQNETWETRQRRARTERTPRLPR